MIIHNTIKITHDNMQYNVKSHMIIRNTIKITHDNT